MLSLFKKYASIFASGECVIFAICAAFIKDGAKNVTVLFVALILSALLFLYCQLKAVSLFQRLLGLLYHWQQPSRFVEAFSPLLGAKRVRNNLLFTVNAYLSNGYAAMGDFEKALSLLDSAPNLPPSRRMAGEVMLCINRCSALLYMAELERAKGQYEKLCGILDDNKESRALREYSKSAELLRLRLRLADGEATKDDADTVREALKEQASAFHKTELNYLLGMIYKQLEECDFARYYLSDAAQNGGETWLAKEAAREAESI